MLHLFEVGVHSRREGRKSQSKRESPRAGRPLDAVMSAYILSAYVRYQQSCARPRAEARIGGTADPLAARRAPPARLRPQQVDRDTVRRAAEISYRFPLPLALPPRRA